MKAVAYRESLPVTDPDSLLDVELADPVPTGHDLLVEVRAVWVNPVDTKMRMRSTPGPGEQFVLGWDAAGVVAAIGPDVTLFKPGDEVWYAGAIDRPGSNAELHVVDERIVGHKPRSLDFARAAAMPLTAITAWELLFERLRVPTGKAHDETSLLVIGAAGGVGSMLIQLARRLTGVRVIGTASRAETRDWVSELGAHAIADHSKPLPTQLAQLHLPPVDRVASLTHTDQHFEQIIELLAPQGRLALIDDPGPLDIRLLKRKSLSLHWELMFTRSLFQTPDMVAQHRLLDDVAQLVDDGVIRTTLGEHFGTINAENLRRAHALIESGRARGKVVLEGF